MNPGSSQFASQFPDAEETMSKMESKKLKTTDYDLSTGVYGGTAERLQHDARIAHELMEVIGQLVNALKHEKVCRYCGEGYCGMNQECGCSSDAALAAAAPFLED